MFIGVSAPRVIDAADVATMADRAIVFALANPEPEIDPAEATQHAEVVATGRSDFPNQINNVLAFPGVFRGLLDARSTDITAADAAGRGQGAGLGGRRRRAERRPTSPRACSTPTCTAGSPQAVRVAAGGPAELPTDTEVVGLTRSDPGPVAPLGAAAAGPPDGGGGPSRSRSGCTAAPAPSEPALVPAGRQGRSTP